MIEGSKNKGDWGEFYAFLYLLAKQRVYSADERLNKIPDYYFPLIKIKRNEHHKATDITNRMDYVVASESGNKIVEIYKDTELVKTMTAQEFQDEVDLLVQDIPAANGRQFIIEHGEKFLNMLFLERLATPPTEVTDIMLSVWDTNTGRKQDMGFSIKSYLGGAPTLLNASEATNFVYEISGIDDNQMNEINTINTSKKIVDRINRIKELGGTLSYSHTANFIFSTNLMMVDSLMEQILAEMLLYFYQSKTNSCREIINYIEKVNPLNYPRPSLYTYKFKKFLSAKALGMNPSKEWGGLDDANGGYLAVKSDGEVLAYFLYDRNKFEQYLLDNTHFEKGSTSKHNFASVYKENDKYYINLNLQIRFFPM